MSKDNPKLSFDEAISLLPASFKPLDRTFYQKHRLRAETPSGIISYSASREYPDKIWWTSVYPRVSENEVDYWIIGLDVRGILILPDDLVSDFCIKNNVPKLASGKWSIHIKMDNSNFYLFHSDKLCDVTQYFHTNQ